MVQWESRLVGLRKLETLNKVFNDERRLVLIENGIQSIEKLLEEERIQTVKEIEEKKSVVEKLKRANQQTSETVKKMNEEILCRKFIISDLDEQIDQFSLDLMSLNLHTKAVESKIGEKRQEYEDTKAEFEKKKREAEEKVLQQKIAESEVANIKTSLKEESEKLEKLSKKNEELLEEIVTLFRRSQVVSESRRDEALRNRLLSEKSAELK